MPGLDVAIGTALLQAGATFATASAIVTALPTLALAAASIASSVVIAERARQAYASARTRVNDDRGLQQPIPEAAPEHLLLLGSAVLSGKPFFYAGGEENRPYFWLGTTLAAHECAGLVAVYINNNRILIDPVTRLATSTPFNDGTMSFIEVSFRAGTLDQAIDPIIARDFPLTASTFRQRGHATVVIKAHYGTGGNINAQDDKHKALYGDGPFNPIYEVRGAKVYDPRALNQDKDDPSTWAWSDKASLGLILYLCWKFPEMRQRIDWSLMAAAADIDDEIVHTKALEAIRRHTIDGAISSGDEAEEAIAALLSANSGQLVRKAGKIYVLPAQRRKPVGTLHAGNLRGGIFFAADNAHGETVNEMRPEFFSPERNFKIVPGPVIRDAAAVAADGVERPATVRLPFTRRHERAQRIATRLYKEARVPQTASGGCDISARSWQAGDVINLDLAVILPALTGTWQILRKGFDPVAGHYQLDLRKYDDAVHDFDPQTEEQDFTVTEAA